MENKYTYPRVDITYKAKRHSSTAPEQADTSSIFVPVITERGPINKVVKVHSISELESTFGEVPYKENGLTKLNLYRWLNAGGTAYIVRLVADVSEVALAYAVSSTTNAYVVTKNGLPAETASDILKVYLKERGSFIEAVLKTDDTPSGVPSYIFDNSTRTVTVTDSEGSELDDVVLATRISAKYPGKYYNGLSVTISKAPNSEKKLVISVYRGSQKIDETRVEPSDFIDLEYINFSSNAETLLQEILDNANNYEKMKRDVEKANIYIRNGEVYESSTSVTAIDETTLKETYGDNFRSYISGNSDFNKRYDTSVEYNISYSGTYTSATLEDLLKAFWSQEALGNYSYDFAGTNTLGATSKESRNSDDYRKGIFWKRADQLIANKLETPFDLVMDAGYSAEVKMLLFKFFSGATPVRNDAFVILDNYSNAVSYGYGYNLGKEPKYVGFEENGQITADLDNTSNLAIYTQYFLIKENNYVGSDIFVTMSYFLAALLPSNDATYGIQAAVAGQNRYELKGIKSISENPMPDTKEEWFRARINYAEKDSRGYYIMNQRTFDGSTEDEYTGLSFVNNSRALIRMRHELEAIGRGYLFEFADTVTISNLSAVLNKYMTQWVSNRTLIYANVNVSKNEFSDETLDVTLSVKFNGTLEVISVAIDID